MSTQHKNRTYSKEDREYLGQIANLFPSDVDVWLNLAKRHLKEKPFQEKWDAFKEGIKRNRANTWDLNAHILVNHFEDCEIEFADLAAMALSSFEWPVFIYQHRKRAACEAELYEEIEKNHAKFSDKLRGDKAYLLTQLSDDALHVVNQTLIQNFGRTMVNLRVIGHNLALAAVANMLLDKNVFYVFDERLKARKDLRFSKEELRALPETVQKAVVKLQDFSKRLNTDLVLGSLPATWVHEIINQHFPTDKDKEAELLKQGLILKPYPSKYRFNPEYYLTIHCSMVALLAAHYPDFKKFSIPRDGRFGRSSDFAIYCEEKLGLKRNFYPALLPLGLEEINNLTQKQPQEPDALIAYDILLAGALGIERYNEPEFVDVRINKLDGRQRIVPRSEWKKLLIELTEAEPVRYSSVEFQGKSIVLNELPYVELLSPKRNAYRVIRSNKAIVLLNPDIKISPSEHNELREVQKEIKAIVPFNPGVTTLALPFKHHEFQQMQGEPKENQANDPEPVEDEWQDLLRQQIETIQKIAEWVEMLNSKEQVIAAGQLYEGAFEIYKASGAQPIIQHHSLRIFKPTETHQAPEEAPSVDLDENDLLTLLDTLDKNIQLLNGTIKRLQQSKRVTLIIYHDPNKSIFLPQKTMQENDLPATKKTRVVSDDIEYIAEEIDKKKIKFTEFDKFFYTHPSYMPNPEDWYMGKASDILNARRDATDYEADVFLKILIELEAGIWTTKRRNRVHNIIPGANHSRFVEAVYAEGPADHDLVVVNGRPFIRVIQECRDPLYVPISGQNWHAVTQELGQQKPRPPTLL